MSKVIAERLRKQKIGLFATKETTTEALEYAKLIMCNSKPNEITTAIMVYHNTLLEAMATVLEKEDDKIKEAPQ